MITHTYGYRPYIIRNGYRRADLFLFPWLKFWSPSDLFKGRAKHKSLTWTVSFTAIPKLIVFHGARFFLIYKISFQTIFTLGFISDIDAFRSYIGVLLDTSTSSRLYIKVARFCALTPGLPYTPLPAFWKCSVNNFECWPPLIKHN